MAGMMFLPKSFLEAALAASLSRYCFSTDQVNTYTPMLARLLLGFLGFSSNSRMVLSASTFMMPNEGATSHGTGRTAMVMSALESMWAASILL